MGSFVLSGGAGHQILTSRLSEYIIAKYQVGLPIQNSSGVQKLTTGWFPGNLLLIFGNLILTYEKVEFSW